MTGKRYQGRRPVGLLAPGGVADRAIATVDGVTLAMQQASTAMVATGAVTGRSITRVVAASNASPAMLAMADYQCDGVADEVQINQALTDIAASGGVVQLSEGTFTLAAAVTLTAGWQWLRGMGIGATIITIVNGATGPFTAGIISVPGSWTKVTDLTVHGNRANNGTLTSMVGVYVTGVGAPMVQRIRVIESRSVGISLSRAVTNAVVRDCLVESCSAQGFILAAETNYMTIVSGCTARSTGGAGFWCNGAAGSGGVALSDCQTLTANSWAFIIEASDITLSQCYGSDCPNGGFYLSAARIHLTNCQAIANSGVGFFLTSGASQATLTECLASQNTGTPFQNSGTAVDTFFDGCIAEGPSDSGRAGFFNDGSGRASYIGCQANGMSGWGFYVTNGEVNIRDCYVYGNAAAGNGIELSGGANHVIDGCIVTNNGAYGIVVANIPNVAVTSNHVSNSSLSSETNYYHIDAHGSAMMINGNILRDSLNTGVGLMIEGTAFDTFVGTNDATGTGISVGSEIFDSTGIRLRLPSFLALNYNPTADVVNGLALAAATWTNLTASQSFRVESPQALVEIVCYGCMKVGGGAGLPVSELRLVIDEGGTPIYRVLSVSYSEVAGQYQNSFAGNGPIKLVLAAGAHTARIQVYSTVAANVYLRPATNATLEFLTMQITEYGR